MREAGHTLLELALVLGLMGLLGGFGAALPDPGTAGLAFLPLEMRGALHQGLLLARARGGDVRVALGGAGGEGWGQDAHDIADIAEIGT